MKFTIPSDFSAAREVQKRILDEIDRLAYGSDSAFGIKLSLEEGLINESTVVNAGWTFKFGSHVFHDWKVGGHGPTDVVCGKVNAKNGFGGYTGGKAFVYFVADKRTNDVNFNILYHAKRFPENFLDLLRRAALKKPARVQIL